MAVPKSAPKMREKAREFALGLPGVVEELPWGGAGAKAGKKVFVHLGTDDGSHPLGLTSKRTGGTAHAYALASPGAEPAAYGLGGSGWVRIPLEESGAPAAGLLCDRAGESYRVLAPKKPVAEPDRR
ncbi:MmcQ/YjbR family DNA-binding protein [Streptomyces sp. 142MFCol3.1]|uniref:MmcQ/YjbR family DNA-binding protein n=1 Tax=Streptomyces sp. 142MFCol3.1 TaxID=1172179 RepID=UPI00048AF276|nr:MmcQ/YjbR family DNA-binding protein [Streptomyces sp. 142MFCol3.1]